VAAFVALSAAALVVAAGQLNPLCLYLSPVALAILFAYSLTKRFTWTSHLVLGLSLGGAPVGAWIAVTGRLDPASVLLGGAVLAWVAGFDVLYALQDHEFDLRTGLHSIPARFGVARSLWVARILHGMALALLASLGALMELRSLYLGGLLVVAGLLLYEHSLVRADDLSRLDTAFFTMNGIISVVYLVATAADLLLLGGGPGLVRP
jgi:4-hydroxybenzoate polyprenyltransferase